MPPRGQEEPIMEGALNINKPRGMTSHDVVLRIRRLLGPAKIGHAGTLDPQATGVLLLLVGRATKIVQFITHWSKEYLARMRFGTTTSTQDIWGETLKEVGAGDITIDKIRKILPQFCGETLQIPPVISALHHKGERLYRLVREGKRVEPAPRKINIYEIEPLEFSPGANPELSLRVVSSGGTYIRTLCHDIGDALGVGGCLTQLLRRRVGPFCLSSSIDLQEFETMEREAQMNQISPIDEILQELPRVGINKDGTGRIIHGQPLISSWIEQVEGEVGDGSLIRIYSSSSRLLAIARTIQNLCQPGIVARPLRVLN